jgi:hypothetical protein
MTLDIVDISHRQAREDELVQLLTVQYPTCPNKSDCSTDCLLNTISEFVAVKHVLKILFSHMTETFKCIRSKM